MPNRKKGDACASLPLFVSIKGFSYTVEKPAIQHLARLIVWNGGRKSVHFYNIWGDSSEEHSGRYAEIRSEKMPKSFLLIPVPLSWHTLLLLPEKKRLILFAIHHLG